MSCTPAALTYPTTSSRTSSSRSAPSYGRVSCPASWRKRHDSPAGRCHCHGHRISRGRPLATRSHADLGARVIKVERVDGGDFARGYDHVVHGTGAHFVWLNRAKESIAIDLKV